MPKLQENELQNWGQGSRQPQPGRNREPTRVGVLGANRTEFSIGTVQFYSSLLLATWRLASQIYNASEQTLWQVHYWI